MSQTSLIANKETFTILGLDPGGVGGDTGLVLTLIEPDQTPTLVSHRVVEGGYDGFIDALGTDASLMDLLMEADVLIVEHFVNRNIPGADLTPVLIEGVVRYLRPDAVLSQAAGKNTAVSDEALKNLGLYFPGDHHRDRTEAARHLVRWLKNAHHIPTLKKGWPA